MTLCNVAVVGHLITERHTTSWFASSSKAQTGQTAYHATQGKRKRSRAMQIQQQTTQQLKGNEQGQDQSHATRHKAKKVVGMERKLDKGAQYNPPLQKKGHQNKNKKIENRTDARCKVTIKALDSHPFFCFPLPPPSPFFFSPGQPTTPPITPPPARRLTRPWRSRRCSRVQRAACPTAARVPSAQTAGAPPCLSHRPTASPA